jgi:hypothetical protein
MTAAHHHHHSAIWGSRRGATGPARAGCILLKQSTTEKRSRQRVCSPPTAKSIPDAGTYRTAASPRLDRLAMHSAQLIIADAQVRELRELFLDEARGLDQRVVIRRVITRTSQGFPNAKLVDVSQAIWADAHRVLGWSDVFYLDPQGSA